MKLHRYVDHQRLHIVTKDVISLSISVLLLFRHYISHKITFGAPSSGGVLRSACGAFIYTGVGAFCNLENQFLVFFTQVLLYMHWALKRTVLLSCEKVKILQYMIVYATLLWSLIHNVTKYDIHKRVINLIHGPHVTSYDKA